MSKTIATENAPAAIGPYVQGVDLGSMIITSGQIPVDPKTGSVPEEVSAQARQSLNNVKAIVEAAGLTVGDIVKTTVFVKDLNDFATVNATYEAFFTEHNATFPARSCVEVARLPKDVKIEIEAIAVRHDRSRRHEKGSQWLPFYVGHPKTRPSLPAVAAAVEALHGLGQHHIARQDRHQPWEVAQRQGLQLQVASQRRERQRDTHRHHHQVMANSGQAARL